MTTPPTSPAHRQDTGGIKDTIESILIAFILAFVFRAFIVEAFVIPTGSMAPTLLGANMRFTCPDCGYSFTVNYSGRSEGDDIIIPHTAGPLPVINDKHQLVGYRNAVYNLYCPNCGFQLHSDVTTNPPVHYGDRILVLKYLYLLQNPKRWDVVVFKAPDPPNGQTAKQYDYSTNYIKRLIGRPGEAIVILDGDVYVAPAGATKPSDFKIQTKPRYAQEALWRIVNDNDHYPRQLDRAGQPWRQPWTPVPNTSGWDLGHDALTGRVFHFDNSAGTGALFYDPAANPDQHSLTDWVGYDQAEDSAYRRDPNHWTNPVSDLKLSFFYTRHDGAGPLRLTLSRQSTTLIAEITPNKVRLLKRVDLGPETELSSASYSLPVNKSIHIEFSNVDYRATLRIDNTDLLATTPAQYAPDVQQLLNDYNAGRTYPKPAVQISAANQRADLSHLSLWRDVYYINSRENLGLRWAIPRNFPDNVVRLSNTSGKEEYFVMGDNSVISGDARYWSTPVDLPAEDLHVQSGRVPARFMLGKAFFVYWPAGFRPQASMPDLIPNFGQMRFIH